VDQLALDEAQSDLRKVSRALVVLIEQIQGTIKQR
jgi:hypothetical protein